MKPSTRKSRIEQPKGCIANICKYAGWHFSISPLSLRDIPKLSLNVRASSLSMINLNPSRLNNLLYLDHARTLGDLPDEYLADIGPVLKKVALATGAEQYNVLQVS